jgi:hypothetical protein
MRRVLPLATLALVLAACGERSGDRVETLGETAPPQTQTVGPPATVPARGVAPLRGHAAGYVLAQRDGLMLYSRRVAPNRFRLVARRGSGPAQGVGVPDQRDPFAVDLGTDAAGRNAAVYPRGHRLVVLDPATGRERTALRTPAVARAVAIDGGIITYALIHRHRSAIRAVPADGSAPPRVVKRVHGVVTALDTSPHGMAYVNVTPAPGVAHSRNRLVFRDRTVDLTGYGEEGGSDIVSLSFSGDDLVYGITGDDGTTPWASVERRDLRTGRHTSLTLSGGELFSAAPDAARADGRTLVAVEPVATGDGFSADPDREVLRRFPASAYGRAR